jgi:hypothetical protein
VTQPIWRRASDDQGRLFTFGVTGEKVSIDYPDLDDAKFAIAKGDRTEMHGATDPSQGAMTLQNAPPRWVHLVIERAERKPSRRREPNVERVGAT